MTSDRRESITLAELLEEYDLMAPARLRHGTWLPAIDADVEGYALRLVPRGGRGIPTSILTRPDGTVWRSPSGLSARFTGVRILGLPEALANYRRALAVVTRLDPPEPVTTGGAG